MNVSKYLLPLVCGAILTVARANPTYTLVTGYGTFDVTLDDTSFVTDSAELEATPWWNDVGLTYALSSTLYGEYGYNGTNLAVFAVGLPPDYSATVNLNNQGISSDTGDVIVNTNNPSIGYPYFAAVNPEAVEPYVVLARSAPDASSTLLLCGAAASSLLLLKRRRISA